MRLTAFFSVCLLPLLASACSSESSPNPGGGSGGSPSGTGGTPTGGSFTGGTSSGGNPTGGTPTGGSPTGGTSTGGSAGATGGSASGSAGAAGTAGGSSGAGGGKGGGMILVSDNFDAGAMVDATKWLAPGPGSQSAPVIDTSKSHSPPNSVRATGTGAPDGFLIPASGLPAPGNRFYVRVWANFEKPTSAVTGHSGFLVGAESRDNSGIELRLGISSPTGAMAMLDLNLQNPKDGGGEVTRFSNGYTTGGEPLSDPGFGFEANRWYCIEALFSGSPSEFQVWVDGTDVAKLHVTDFKGRETDMPRTMWAPTFTFLKIGAQDYGGNIGQIWYDDIVVSTAGIGCN